MSRDHTPERVYSRLVDYLPLRSRKRSYRHRDTPACAVLGGFSLQKTADVSFLRESLSLRGPGPSQAARGPPASRRGRERGAGSGERGRGRGRGRFSDRRQLPCARGPGRAGPRGGSSRRRAGVPSAATSAFAIEIESVIREKYLPTWELLAKRKIPVYAVAGIWGMKRNRLTRQL